MVSSNTHIRQPLSPGGINQKLLAMQELNGS
jgi:hypothetical protein